MDRSVAVTVANFLLRQGAKSVMDLGCGCGQYLKVLDAVGFHSRGVDLNPYAPELSGGLCAYGDITAPLGHEERSDWALSLEVAEHVPSIFERAFLENINQHAQHGVIISWASRTQIDRGHVNLRDSDEVQAIFAEMGFAYDEPASAMLRAAAAQTSSFGACCGHFAYNLHVFQRMSSSFTPHQDFQMFLDDVSRKGCARHQGSDFSCDVCEFRLYPARPGLTLPSQVLWDLNGVSMAEAELLCCREGPFRCAAVYVDPGSGRIQLLSEVTAPSEWQWDLDAVLRVMHTWNLQGLKRESEVKKPHGKDIAFWTIAEREPCFGVEAGECHEPAAS